jgi:Transcriptional regulator
LAESVEELMQKTPIGKITVNAITANCGTTRQTFYNNFKDKYDLLAWIHVKNINSCLTELEDNFTWYEVTLKILNKMQEKSSFYINAFSSNDQNSLIDFIYKRYLDMSIEEIKRRFGLQLIDDDLLFALKFFLHSQIWAQMEWVKSRTKMPAEKLTQNLVDCLPQKLISRLSLAKRNASMD